MDTPSSHALGDRSVLYDETMANATALLQVLKVLDRGMFDKVIQKYVVRCLSFMNTKDFGDFFSKLRDAAAARDLDLPHAPPLLMLLMEAACVHRWPQADTMRMAAVCCDLRST